MFYVFNKNNVGIETTKRKAVSFLTIFDTEGDYPVLHLKAWAYRHSSGEVYNLGYEVIDGTELLAGYRKYNQRPEHSFSEKLSKRRRKQLKRIAAQELEELSDIILLDNGDEWAAGWSMPLVYSESWHWLADQFQDWAKAQRREERQERRLRRLLGEETKYPRRK